MLKTQLIEDLLPQQKIPIIRPIAKSTFRFLEVLVVLKSGTAFFPKWLKIVDIFLPDTSIVVHLKPLPYLLSAFLLQKPTDVQISPLAKEGK